MTTGAFGRLIRLRLIFDALVRERFIRGPLLRELIALAGEGPGFAEVGVGAEALLQSLDQGIDDAEFGRRIEAVGVGLALLEGLAGSSGPLPLTTGRLDATPLHEGPM